ncbi:MAG: hypothetical protein ABSC94_25505 [Polyangiaceae bacterium]|jgi:hypothetical protein
MGMAGRSLSLSAVLALVGLLVLDVALGKYAETHFAPNSILRAAEAAGDGCVLTLGDSRMQAGIDSASLGSALRRAGMPCCVAPLAIGALPISGAAMAMRRFVADGKRPRVVVLGESAGSLLPYVDAPDPADFFVGNGAAQEVWSVGSDVSLFYPGFPFRDFDRGVRFLLTRTNALQTYDSLVWVKAKELQERFVRHGVVEPRNRFGTISDMRALVESFRASAMRALRRYDARWRTSPWFDMVRAIARGRGVPLVVVEVPMPSAYRDRVLASPEGIRYRDWLRTRLSDSGDFFIDLSAPSSIGDESFSDGVHLDESGARAFSMDLGQALAPILASTRQEP